MGQSMKLREIWKIMEKFKTLCRRHGWKASDDEDWVAVDGHYHNFLMARWIHPSSFKKIALDRKCIVREGLSYHVFEATYVAWLFSEPPLESLVEMVLENPDLCKSIAIYDLGSVRERRKPYGRLNRTRSQVFHEFEKFLQIEYGAKFKPIPPILDRAKIIEENATIPGIA